MLAMPDEPVRFILLGLGHFAGGHQVEHAVAFDQVRFALPVLDQHFEGLRCAGEAHVLQAACGGPDGHRLLVVLPAQTPVVVRLGGFGPEGDRLRLGVAAAFAAGCAEVAGPDIGRQRGVGVADLLDDLLGGLGAQPARLQLGVGVLAQLVLARHAVLEGHRRDPVGGLVEGAQGR
ncbi:hypothetical protein [Streptomonospora litoralis]|uniref:hypothetical protein n=1 Tax=Streptomonospora litoralis TaxID=2498135 RepID=UPI0031014EE4